MNCKDRGRRLRHLAAWLALLVLSGLAALFSEHPAGKAAFFFFLLLPFISLLAALPVRRHLTAAFSLPLNADKSRPFSGAIAVHNSGFFACREVYVPFSLKNELTGETIAYSAVLSAPSRGSAAASFSFTPDHCGMYTFSVKQTALKDWFGFLRICAQLETRNSVMVLPTTFPANISVTLPYSEQGDEEDQNPLRGTEDPTVIRSLREYTAGDPVRRIHWKLSAKRETPIVKEAGRPVSRSLLLFWNKTAGVAPDVCDALAEAFFSAALSLASQGIPFTLGWNDENGIHAENINNEEELFPALSAAVRHGAGANSASANAIGAPPSKSLWFAGEYPVAEESLLSIDSTVFLCSREQPVAGNRRTVVFSPEEAQDVFRAIRV